MNNYKVEKEIYKIKLNANENPYEVMFDNQLSLNRYPNESNELLINILSKKLSVSENQFILGNGSNEMIELIMKTYLKPKEIVMSFQPSFQMYRRYTESLNGIYIGVETENYVMDMDLLKEKVAKYRPKIVFICNPNNPTGSKVSKNDLENFLKFYRGLLVIDEAYMEFTEGSMINRLNTYENLIILKTFSKAYGLAGARLGYLMSQPQKVLELLEYKTPYNVSQLSLEMGIKVLGNDDLVLENIKKIKMDKDILYKALYQLPIKVFSSFANFIAFEGPESLMTYLKSRGILIRKFDQKLYRVTVGTKEENDVFLYEMAAFFKGGTYDYN